MKVLIDPGHAPGNANGGRYGFKEYAGMWKLSNFLKDALINSSVRAELTRAEHTDPPLEVRGGMAKGHDMFISQHSNAFNGMVRGVECFYSVARPNDRAIAGKLTAAVSRLMDNPDRGAKNRVGNSGMDFYGVIRAAVAAGCPHVFLMENGFHDNELDEAFLLKDENLQRIAEVQAQVILDALGVKKASHESRLMKCPIIGTSALSAEQLAAFLLSRNPHPKISCTALELAWFFVIEGDIEGVRGDVAFCQSILETGWFRYGGQVLPEQNNFGGIGAINNSEVGAGAWFNSPQIGVRAQIQHLKAYASTQPLKQANVNPRFHLVTRGIAPFWEDLNGRWAVPGTYYAQTILHIYETALEFAIRTASPAPEHIVNALASKVRIASPDYWIKVLKGREKVNVKFLNTLLARLAGFNV